MNTWWNIGFGLISANLIMNYTESEIGKCGKEHNYAKSEVI